MSWYSDDGQYHKGRKPIICQHGSQVAKCGVCQTAYKKAWYDARAPHERTKRREHYIANRDDYLARSKKWAKENIEQYRHTQTIAQRRRRTRLMGMLTYAEWQEIKEKFNHCCAYCGKKYTRLTRDHVIPVAKRGYNTKDNVVPACKSCNSRKQAKDVTEFVSMDQVKQIYHTMGVEI